MNIVYVYYIRGGGMDGACTEICVRYDKESGDAHYQSKSRSFWNKEDETVECKVDAGLLADILQEVTANNLVAASEKPLSDDTVLDGACSTLDIRFEDGVYIRLEDSQLLNEEEFSACKRIVGLLKNEKYRLN